MALLKPYIYFLDVLRTKLYVYI